MKGVREIRSRSRESRDCGERGRETERERRSRQRVSGSRGGVHTHTKRWRGSLKGERIAEGGRESRGGERETANL